MNAYFEQMRSLIELSVHANTILGEAHRVVRPTPFLSSIFEGPLDRGVDLVAGGAIYNSTGVANVGWSMSLTHSRRFVRSCSRRSDAI